MIPHWAVPGARVVCVDGDFSRYPSKLVSMVDAFPEQGTVYTIRASFLCQGRAYAHFEEIRNTPVKYGRWNGEPRFGLSRFRPLVENNHTEEQDVALFRHHLVTAPVTERV